MCINPSFIWVERGPKWEQEPVACRQCWRCKQNRVNDYVGRSLAEAATSSTVCALTLTYAPRDDLADKVLHPSHFQLFMKRLRRAGHKVRYLVAGEYGPLRGRAHFHCLLFFAALADEQGPAPFYNSAHVLDPDQSAPFSRQIPQKRMYHIREWPHGHIQADWTGDEAAIRYVCKYLLAENKNNAWFSCSKKPTLGHEWFMRKAQKARDLDVLPSSFEYLPPGGRRDRPYLLTGATRRDYLNAISTDPDLKPRMSEWVRKSFEKYERQRWLAIIDALPPDEVLAGVLGWREFRERQHRNEQALARQAQIDDLGDAILKHGGIALIVSGRIIYRGQDYGPSFKTASRFDRD